MSRLEKIFCWASITLIFYAIAAMWWFETFSAAFSHCADYTQRMNGGVHVLAGQSYRVTLCGLSRMGVDDDSDLVRLQIQAMDGELLAERYFVPDWAGSFTELTYETDRLIFHNGRGRYWESSLPMPPTWLDWVRARFCPIPPLDALMTEVDHWFHRETEPTQYKPCEGCRIEEVAPEDVPEALRRAGIKP
jgi:hypothetical protein